MTRSMKVNLEREQVNLIVDLMTQREQSKDEFSQPTESFPSESELLMLLDTAVRYQNEAALLLVENRLTDMAFGGIRDHVGGGFHRYTVDSEWRIPHFEKNALQPGAHHSSLPLLLSDCGRRTLSPRS